jgi:uncharacterized membrane protein
MSATSRPGEAEKREASDIDGVMRRNIQALLEHRRQLDRRKGREEVVADAITAFTGSMPFVYLHAALFGAWIVVNVGVVPGIRPFDPFPFVMLAMFASVEAIFLSTFVLISQNRMAAMADRRADLDLQINLLAEHEITHLIALCDDIAKRVGVRPADREHVEELKRDVAPDAVLEEIDRAQREHGR